MWKIENQNKDFDYYAPRLMSILGLAALAILAALARHQYPGLWRDVGVVLLSAIGVGITAAIFIFVFTDAARQVREVLKGEPEPIRGLARPSFLENPAGLQVDSGGLDKYLARDVEDERTGVKADELNPGWVESAIEKAAREQAQRREMLAARNRAAKREVLRPGQESELEIVKK